MIYKYNSFMKLIIKIILIVIFSSVSAYSVCDLKIELGASKQVFEQRKIALDPFPLEYGLEVYPTLANDICPSERLDNISIEYRFLNDELVAVNFVALNNVGNQVTEKLTLMTYVKKNYKNFETPNNPKAFEGVEVIEKSNLFLVYQRLTGENGIKDEQLYISTPELDEKLGKFYSDQELNNMENN